MASPLVFYVPPPPISERATLMSLQLWALRRQTHQQLSRCACSPACLRGDQYIGILILENKDARLPL